jgi:hypothetical protein
VVWVWFGFCFFWSAGACPTWVHVFRSLRTVGYGRVRAWVVASALAIIWPWFVPQYRRSLRRRPVSWVDQVEAELHSLDPR